MTAFSDGRWYGYNIKAKIASLSGTVILFAAPFIVSGIIYSSYSEKENPLDVAVFQPNIDPYNKFQALTQQQQTDILIGQMTKTLKESEKVPVLLLAPETFTGDIVVGEYNTSVTYRRFVDFLKEYPGTGLLFGASSYGKENKDRPMGGITQFRSDGGRNGANGDFPQEQACGRCGEDPFPCAFLQNR